MQNLILGREKNIYTYCKYKHTLVFGLVGLVLCLWFGFVVLGVFVCFGVCFIFVGLCFVLYSRHSIS